MALTGCGGGTDNPKQQIIAKIGGEPVGQAEFDAYLKFKRIPGDNASRVETAKSDYLQRGALAKAIAQSPTLDSASIEAEVEEFRRQALISRYFEVYLKQNVTDQAAQNYYSTHADQFADRKVHVAHVLLRTRPGMTEEERGAVLTTAREAHSKITSGEPFESVVQAYSEDKNSLAKGGDLGWLKEGSISAAFSKRIFELKTGEISEPFQTEFGIHIVKHIEGPSVVHTPFEAVQGNILHQLRGEAREAEAARLLSSVSIEKTSN